jgi:AICAR transformylase/IMP cyclohydrolase PurH
LPAQDADSLTPEQIEFKQVSESSMTPAQLEDLKFAWRWVLHQS